MGAKQSRTENVLLSDTRRIQVHCLKETETETMQLEENIVQTPTKPVDNLRKRIFRGFAYNLNDPRSPSMQLNRTPLVFEDRNEKTLNLDDTFADLFVTNRIEAKEMESQPNNPKIENIESTEEIKEGAQSVPQDFNEFEDALSLEDSKNRSIEFSSLCDEETVPLDVMLPQTPLLLQQALDPRSPTIGLTRTPIIFKDDEAEEDAMLEDILATLSLEISACGSPKSFTASSPLPADMKKPTNKHLDRVRAVKKPEKPIRKSKHLAQKSRIYLDCENSSNCTTPKRKVNTVMDMRKRTPFSCVKNRAHLRSRSVESTGKSPKTRLSLTSYDDVLNPVQDRKVTNLHILADDQFDLN